jgi:hypothetical protein
MTISERAEHAAGTVCNVLMNRCNNQTERDAVKHVYEQWEEYFLDLLSDCIDLEEYPTPKNIFQK